MIAGAGIIVFSAFTNIKNYANLGASINKTIDGKTVNSANQINELNKPLSQKSDIDKDGLFDEEEPIYRSDPLNPDTDGDGFLDGEEVAAGCSPISASQKDCQLKPGISQTNLNLTEYFTSLIVGGFLSKDLDKSDPGYLKHIDSLVQEASQIKKTLLSADQPDFEKQNSNKPELSNQEYLNQFENILRNHFLKKKPKGIQANSDFDYSPYLKDAGTTYEKLAKLNSPKELAEFHKESLNFFYQLKSYFSNLQNKDGDPIKALLSLEQTEQLTDKYRAFLSILPLPGIVVPVDDARAIQLLHNLRDKELIDDPAQRALASENLNLATTEIIRLLQAMGRKGDINDTGTLNIFVDNWRNFSLEGQYRAEDFWRGLLDIAANGTDTGVPPLLCDHIRNSEAFNALRPRKIDNLIESGIQRRVGSLQEYLVATKCDTFVDKNYDIFMQDFSAGGGWDMWFKLIEPQNNIFGAIDLALGELNRQRQVEEQSDLQEANSGSGYLGRRQCLSTGSSGQCVIWSPVNIPANLAVEVLGALLNQNLGWIVATDEAGEGFGIEINQVIEAIFGPQE